MTAPGVSTVAVVAITRSDIAEYVSTLILVYTILVFAEILLSWLPSPPASPVLSGLTRFVHDVTEPYLGVFRRVIPPFRVGAGLMDLSPIAGLVVLWLVQQFVPSLIAG